MEIEIVNQINNREKVLIQLFKIKKKFYKLEKRNLIVILKYFKGKKEHEMYLIQFNKNRHKNKYKRN